MSAIDKFESYVTGLSDLLDDFFTITPDDNANLDFTTRGIYVFSGGTLHVITKAGSDVTVSVNAGYHPIRVKKIYSTGTTATGLWGGV